ncbi:hypothetical protein K431DRAFT_341837 [Polychaeton citri CBS 116435]|uniref:Cytochrome b2 n=1 Tax=Polychaeton citri CBS 116435 TaxID=1314669 RepID=A0A9P4Q238_9PEZI|nr:hypothetical protein K431DRAFT_341837 [Polychaeton citri CBS 116435]
MSGEARRAVTVEEILRHNSQSSCWLVVDGKVWDLTSFAPQHPGGGAIIWQHAGRDASASYNSIHAPSVLASNLDASCYKGELDASTVTAEWAAQTANDSDNNNNNNNNNNNDSDRKPPLASVISAQDFEDAAAASASAKAWAFYSSADTDCVTRDANRRDFSRIRLRPRLMRDVKAVSTATTILGERAGLPVFVSPAAMARMVHPDGEKGIARGCVAQRVPQCISTNASFPIAEIVASLYVNKDRAASAALLRHVRSLGVRTVFVTIDAPQPGKREADERVRADTTLASPMSGARAANDSRGGGMGRLMGGYIAADFTLAELGWLRSHWPGGRVVVKGVQSWEDAALCFQAGVDGVLLSNHGGRNLDTAPSSVLTLLECQANCPEIFARPGFEVLVDGGIRRGADVLKCLCLGATAVGLGRPFLYANCYGSEGVAHLVDIIRGELETAMALVGITDLAQCGPEYVSTLELDGMVVRGREHPYAKGRRGGGPGYLWNISMYMHI